MVKKKVDDRIRTLIENGVALRQRSMFVIVGDRGRDQVVNLHYMLSKARVRTRPNVLWCYKKELGFTSNRIKRAKRIKREIRQGIREADEEDPFELFISSTDIRYCYYKETDRILGQTFGMCILQDFQAITPNILARTIETVEGGGIIILLIKTLDSLKQLYSMTMDIHARYRTDAHTNIVGRFNERFMLSLAKCKNCLVVDDELNILNISSHASAITKVDLQKLAQAEAKDGEEAKIAIIEDDHILSPKEVELKELKLSLRNTPPIGPLLDMARTLDQAKGILTFAEAISEKSMKATVALLAGRGRGKSAALGIALAAAIAYGYSNIFVTAPSPENLKTLFEMAVKGFGALGYKEHIDYEVVESTNPKLAHCVVRINVFRSHRQTIQYILPEDASRLTQCELLVIDEAAAIPLPVVQRLFGPYTVFLASTVNGYEGTGRSLSLKLIKQLRDQAAATHITALSSQNKSNQAAIASAQGGGIQNDPYAMLHASQTGFHRQVTANLRGRTLREVTLSEPIRYAENDPVEQWLNNLLCLNCTSQVPTLQRGLGGTGIPHPSLCDLYYVDRDALFSHHIAAEKFLQHMMSLYVSSHYKNSPNDLQLMSDAPQHILFVLLGPNANTGRIPDILCVIQVALEGEISASAVIHTHSRGVNPSGDLIPWSISQQFQNNEFAALSGARVVRIAVHPELQGMGYGSRAIELLTAYFEGKLTSLGEDDEDVSAELAAKTKALQVEREEEAKSDGQSKLLTEVIAPRKNIPPLLTKVSDRRPEALHWLGVSFGMTKELFRFWAKLGFLPLYVRQTVNEVTGEHTCIMVRALKSQMAEAIAVKHGIAHTVGGDETAAWLKSFHMDFIKRFQSYLGYSFRALPASLALLALETGLDNASAQTAEEDGDDGYGNRDDDMDTQPVDVDAIERRLHGDVYEDDEGAEDEEDEEKGDSDEEEAEEHTSSATKNQVVEVNESKQVAKPRRLTQVSGLLSYTELMYHFSEYDLKRLESYARNLVDYHMILDLLPTLARLYFSRRTNIELNATQATLLCAMGLQFKSITDVEFETGLGATQLLAMFNKTIRKLSTFLRAVEEEGVAAEILSKTSGNQGVGNLQSKVVFPEAHLPGTTLKGGVLPERFENELKSASSEGKKIIKQSLSDGKLGPLAQFAINQAADWSAAEAAVASGKLTVSLPASKEKLDIRQKIRDGGTPADRRRRAMMEKSGELVPRKRKVLDRE